MKSTKFIIPAAIVTCFSLTSCNGNAGRLSRETYGTKVETLTELTETLANIGKAQLDNGVYKLDKGTMTIKFDLALTGSIYAFENTKDGRPEVINLNNIAIALSDNIEVKWDVSHDYLGVTNKNGESLFIKKVDDKWGTYYVKTIGGKKFYRPIKNEWFGTNYFKDPKNYLMYAMAEHTGFFRSNYDGNNVRGVGFDISGFGGDLSELIKPDKTKEGDEKTFLVSNYLAPGLLTSNDLDIPVKGEENPVPIKTIIDGLVASQKDITNPSIPLKAEYTKNDKGDGATINLGVNKIDLTRSDEIVKDILDTLGYDPSELKDKIYTKGSGDLALDYFVNFKDNFVHQQELALDFNKANLQLVFDNYRDYYQKSFYLYVNLKDINAHGYLNQSVELGKCDYQEPDTSGYEKLDPIPVPQPEA